MFLPELKVDANTRVNLEGWESLKEIVPRRRGHAVLVTTVRRD